MGRRASGRIKEARGRCLMIRQLCQSPFRSRDKRDEHIWRAMMNMSCPQPRPRLRRKKDTGGNKRRLPKSTCLYSPWPQIDLRLLPFTQTVLDGVQCPRASLDVQSPSRLFGLVLLRASQVRMTQHVYYRRRLDLVGLSVLTMPGTLQGCMVFYKKVTRSRHYRQPLRSGENVCIAKTIRVDSM